ncbi:hypothetical protein M406DRAFT_71446 [Cryphonectria parasitica EP155]|uniref:Uncharacterized protein n=1 Tax=Cryphonectria parasitica (strain ATCC 38755 / EP155) TaxID=660469 RepID=A0A9P5CSC3_CRYP1|nr:uncharacterized protein M406DRAFT_71446 [Cryphonectria parasitica EP155]KAF3768437.1 hypothetical protein M406DRAFT_71446 [Cryphonectria parasitica EP155]
MEEAQFAWVNEFRQEALNNWRRYKERFRAWHRKSNAAITELQDAGQTEDAGWLAEQLWDYPDARDPDHFNVVVLPEDGRRETWQIIGEQDTAQKNKPRREIAETETVLGQPYQSRRSRTTTGNASGPLWSERTEAVAGSAFRRVLSEGPDPFSAAHNRSASRCDMSSLAIASPATGRALQSGTRDRSGPISLDDKVATPPPDGHSLAIPTAPHGASTEILQISPPPPLIDPESNIVHVEFLDPLMLSEAKQQKLWICCNLKGLGFCITCSCPGMAIPRDSLDGNTTATTHDVMPRHFHEQPLGRTALEHFRAVHRYKQRVADWERLASGALVDRLHGQPASQILSKARTIEECAIPATSPRFCLAPKWQSMSIVTSSSSGVTGSDEYPMQATQEAIGANVTAIASRRHTRQETRKQSIYATWTSRVIRRECVKRKIKVHRSPEELIGLIIKCHGSMSAAYYEAFTFDDLRAAARKQYGISSTKTKEELSMSLVVTDTN